MSPAHEELSVSSGKLRVRKVIDTEEFDVPSLIFRIESNADQPFLVTVQEELPESIDASSIGFHPQYGSNHWSIDGNKIEFNRIIEPKGSYTTLFAVLDAEPESDDWLWEEPDISISEQADSQGHIVEGDGREEGISQEVTGSSDREAVASTQDEPERDSSVSPFVRGSSPTTVSETDENSGKPSAESTISALAAELDRGDYSEGDLDTIAQRVTTSPSSLESRVDHLQKEIGRLSAYTDSLEEFLDDHGSTQIINSLADDIESIEDEITAVKNTVQSNTEQIQSSVSDIESTAEDLQRTDHTVSSLREEFGELDNRLAAVETSLEENQKKTVALEDSVDELESAIDRLNDSVQSVQSNSERIEDLNDMVSSLEAKVVRATSFQDKLSSTLGSIGRTNSS